MKSLYPKISKALDKYSSPKLYSKYKSTVEGYQFQAHHGVEGKYYGKYASMINPYKGGEKK